MERTRMICLGILLTLVLTAGNCLAQDIVPLGRLFNYWHFAYDVVVEGDYAYVATGISGVQVVDISDPRNPRVVGVFDDFDDEVTRVFLVQGYLYAATYSTVSIFDISNPNRPEIVNQVTAYTFMGELDVNDNRMLAIGEASLVVGSILTGFDVSDPTNPFVIDTLLINTHNGWGEVRDIAAGNGFGCISYEKVYTVSLREGEDMVFLDSLDISGIKLAIDGDICYATTNRGIALIDVSDPQDIELISEVQNNSYAEQLKISNDYLFGISQNYVSIFDITNRRNPTLHTSLRINYIGQWMAAISNQILLTANDSLASRTGISLFDISTPNHPERLGLFIADGEVKDVQFVGDLCYVAARGDGFQVVDASNPSRPTLLQAFQLEGTAQQIEVFGDRAYVAGYSDGVEVFDLSDPSNPSRLRTLDQINLVNFILSGNLIYNIGNAVRIIDVSNLDSIVIGELVSLPRWGWHSGAIKDSILYVLSNATDTLDFAIVDISDPMHPNLLETRFIENSIGLSGICIYGNYLYITELYRGNLWIFDISNPENPNLAVHFEQGYPGLDNISIYNNKLIGVSRYIGLSVFDLSDPLAPEINNNIDDCYYMNAVSVQGHIAAVAQSTSLRFYNLDGQRSVPIFENPLPFTDGLLSAYPNPFNGSTTIKVNLPSNAPMQILLFDLTGRRFGEWNLPAKTTANESRIVLDANNLPSGSLYLQASTGAKSQTIPIIHLK